jgi:CHAD domain-containing protein
VKKTAKKTTPPRWKVDWPAAVNARGGLPDALSHFWLLGDKLTASVANPADLHELRLATKHVRYGLEAFQSIYGRRLGALLQKLRETQQKLGTISDAMATRRWLVRQGFKGEAGAERVMAFLDERARKETGEFVSFWREHWSRTELRQRWVRYLVRYARTLPRRHAERRSSVPSRD